RPGHRSCNSLPGGRRTARQSGPGRPAFAVAIIHNNTPHRAKYRTRRSKRRLRRGAWRNQPMSHDLATGTPLIRASPGAAKDRPNLIRLTPDSLTLATVASTDLEHVIAALKEGGDVAGQVIPLSSLSGASGDEDSTQLTVAFRTGPSREESQAIAF